MNKRFAILNLLLIIGLSLAQEEEDRHRREEAMTPEEQHAYALHQLAEEAKEFEVTYYKLLGVPEDATPSEIKKRYYKLAKELHPDRNPSEEAAIKFRAVAKAHKTLTDPDSKKLYDELLREGLPYDLSESEFRYPWEIYSKYYSAPTHSGRNVIIGLIVVFSSVHYVYMWYAYQSELARAKKSPLYRARLKEKDEKKKKKRGSKKERRRNARESPSGSSDEDDSPPDIEFVNLTQPRILDIFTVWILLLPFRSIWRVVQRIRGIEDNADDKPRHVHAVRLSRYGYKEDYVIEED